MFTDVVVVGAGPTGLTLACALRSAGIAVRLLDKAPHAAVTSRALGLQPRGVEVLERLSALGGIPDRGLPIRRVTVNVDGRPLASFPVGLSTRLGGPRALLISQADIEGALRDRLTALGGVVEWGRAVRGVTASSDGATVHLEDGSDVDAAWVCGADGAHSVVRRSIDVGFPGVPIIERFLLADVRADLDRPRDGAHTWMRGNGMLAAFPLPGDDLWRLMALAPEGLENPAAHEIVEILAGRLADETGGTVCSTEWTSTFRIHRRLADTYRRGRVLLAGDAAHIHSPFGGQGMNTGIGDAENLAFKLALVISGGADDGLLDTYGAERRPVAEDVLSSTSGMTRILLGQGHLSRLLRDRVAVPLLNARRVQQFITDKSSQLQVSYRRGPLGAGNLRMLPGLRPGDRVRDQECETRDGHTVRLHHVLGPGWAILGDGTLDDLATARLGEVASLRGRKDTLLIRPDGHLAWRGTSRAALDAWLEGALGERTRVR